MQKILRKRTFRDLKKHWLRYMALFLLILFGMYIVVGLIGAADNVIAAVEEGSLKNKLEDGNFHVLIPLEDESILDLEEKGITLEEMFYLDYSLTEEANIRIYQNRTKINLIDITTGSLPKNTGEIAIESHFADSHDLTIGSNLELGGQSFQVTGIVTTPDYDLVIKEISDPAADSELFGTAFVCQEQYQILSENKEAVNSEVYSYSYRLNGKMTNQELKDYLLELEIDHTLVEDEYFQDMLEELEATKIEIQEGIQKLEDGGLELSDGMGQLTDNSEELNQASAAIFDSYLTQAYQQIAADTEVSELTADNYQEVLENLIITAARTGNETLQVQLESVLSQLNSIQEYKDSVNLYTDGVDEAAGGSEDLLEGIRELEQQTDEIIEDYFTADIDNLIQFLKKEDNPRIASSVDDVLINKYAGILSGIIVMVLFTVVISVFVVHGIEQELQIIGTFYALGARKKELIRHYLTLPVFITFMGGVIGTVLGFSSFGAGFMALESTDYFSLPQVTSTYPVYLMIYGVIMPPIVAAVVNYIVINRKLSRPALHMLRGEQKQDFSRLKLKSMGYVQKFQIRQFLRELRSSLAVVLGMFISLLIVMLALNCYQICNNLQTQTSEDITFEYLYSFKYPTKEAPEDGEACYSENLKKEAYGYDLDVTLLGIDQDNQFFDFQVSSGKNKVAISQSAAAKFKLKAGDTLVLTDEVREQDYAFTVDKIVPYSIGLQVFMDIDSMRELFDQEEDYYNVVYADQELDVEAGRLYSLTSKADVEKSSQVFMQQMSAMIYSLTITSILVFMIVMYLMMKVMMDRSTHNISLMKVFGYRKKEIKKLYLDGNFVLVAVSAIPSIFLAKFLMDAVYPYLVANVAAGVDVTFQWQLYVALYAGIILCYLVISRMLSGRIHKVLPDELLKNRE